MSASREAQEVTPNLLRGWPLPSAAGDKYSRGQLVVVGGARRSPGAALLTGEAALRVGAGRLTLAVAASVSAQVAVALPECGVVPLDESAQGHVIGAGVRAAGEDIRNADSLVVGPGLDDPDETAELLRQLPGLVSSRAIVVLDGFALGVLPRVSEIAEAFSGRLILTPNQAEAARLLGHAVDEPSRVAPSIAEAYGAVVSCANTIADPIGGLWSAGSGTTGLGTSGSGDVLCGAITGLAARGAEPNQAAVWGTYLHTTAGDARTTASGAIGFLAHELLPELPIILERLRPQ